jgi:hypothetical protein
MFFGVLVDLNLCYCSYDKWSTCKLYHTPSHIILAVFNDSYLVSRQNDIWQSLKFDMTLGSTSNTSDIHYNHYWASDCCLMPIQQFFSYIMARTSGQTKDDKIGICWNQNNLSEWRDMSTRRLFVSVT